MIAPVITAVSLPGEGAASDGVIDRFSMNFSEDMAASTVNDVSNFELRGAGADGVFGNGDDQLYHLSSEGYASGLSASYRVTDGPLQPGAYRFTAGTGLTDRGGNALAADFVRNFSVTGVPGFITESRGNDQPGTATTLSMMPGSGPD